MLFQIENHKSIFRETYDVKDCEFYFSGWRDELGSRVVKKVKEFSGEFNRKQLQGRLRKRKKLIMML